MWTGQIKDHTGSQSREEQSQTPNCAQLLVGNGVSGWQSACLACRAPGWLQSATKKQAKELLCLGAVMGKPARGTGHLPATLEGKALSVQRALPGDAPQAP